MQLSGKVALVTGANAGIGYETALDFYLKGATVIVAGRSQVRVDEAIASMKKVGQGGALVPGYLDLASLQSVKAFSAQIIKQYNRLDLLINNAGVMIPPAEKSADGYEIQFGINYIGHFALTAQLFNLLEATPGSRVVTLSSIAHRGAMIDFENFKLQKPYSPWREYGQSKLADIIFSLELARRLEAKGSQVKSVAAHPGFSKTELQKHMDEAMLNSLQLMTAKDGAQPTITAALSDKVENGQYWGPDGPGEQSGKPALAQIDVAAKDLRLNAKLFDWTMETLGLKFI